MAAATPDNQFYFAIHGRRLGISGDPEAYATGSGSLALLVDGAVVATTRPPIVRTTLGHNGAGSVALGGTAVGDRVIGVTNLTTAGDVTASFESTISIAGQVQQLAATNLSAAQCLFVVQPLS